MRFFPSYMQKNGTDKYSKIKKLFLMSYAFTMLKNIICSKCLSGVFRWQDLPGIFHGCLFLLLGMLFCRYLLAYFSFLSFLLLPLGLIYYYCRNS